MKLLGINNLKKQKGIGKKSIKSKSNTKSKLSKKGGANYTITTLANNGVPNDKSNMSQQCFWISIVDGLNIYDPNHTVEDLKESVKTSAIAVPDIEIEGNINEDNQSFDTFANGRAFYIIQNILLSKGITLMVFKSIQQGEIDDLISLKGKKIIIYNTPGHFELVTKIEDSIGNILYNINDRISNDKERRIHRGRETNEINVYNSSGKLVKLDEINTEEEIDELIKKIEFMKDKDKEYWEGILHKKLESIPSVSPTEAAQQAEKGKTEKEKTEKEKTKEKTKEEKRMKEEINQADFTKLQEIYEKLKGEVEKKLKEIKPSNNSS